MYQTPEMSTSQTYGTQSNNRYIYLRQGANQNHMIHVNPHFNKKKVFVNPNFQSSNNLVSTVPKIHINPNVQNVNFSANKIHVNPKVLKNISTINRTDNVKSTIQKSVQDKQNEIKPAVYSSRTKLIRSSEKNLKSTPEPKRFKTLINTKFKIVKSQINTKKTKSPLSKYKLIQYMTSPEKKKIIVNKFKVDNRLRRSSNSTALHSKKFVSKHKLIRVIRQSKSPNKVYEKSVSSLQKSPNKRVRRISILNHTICNSKYKIVKSNIIKSSSSKVILKSPRNKPVKSPKQKQR